MAYDDEYGYEQDGRYYGGLGESMLLPTQPRYIPISNQLQLPPLNPYVSPPIAPSMTPPIASPPPASPPLPMNRFAQGRGGYIERAGVPGSRMEIRYTSTGQPFISRGGTPGMSESGRPFEELPQQNIFSAASALFPQDRLDAGAAGAPVSPLDASITAIEKQMADYVKYSPENITAQARKEGRPASDIPVLIERYGKMRGDVKYKDLVDSYKNLLELKKGEREKPSEGFKTIETATGIMQWNPKTNRYDIKLGEGKTRHEYGRDNVMVSTPEGYVVVNKLTGEKIYTGLTKPLTGAMIDTEQQLGTIKTTLNMVKNLYRPEYTGPAEGRLGRLAAVTTGNEPDRATFLASINDINNSLIYLKSGKQINEQEYERLRKAIPHEDLADSDFKARMVEFERVLNSISTERAKGKKGWGEATSVAQPSPARGSIMQELPPAAQHTGRIIRDHTTGKRLKSTGQSWVEVQ